MEKEVVTKKYIDEKCSGSCDRHKMGWCSDQYFLGCPMCNKKQYLEMGYVAENYGVPKAVGQFKYNGNWFKV